MDVAVFGAGVGGLTTAITLTKHGHRCQVYEHSDQRMQAGMGFILTPSGLDCLTSLGLQVMGTPLYRFTRRDKSGEVLNEQALLPGTMGVARCAMLNELKAALPEDTLTVGKRLLQLDFEANGHVAAAHLSAGKTVRADLYVAGDGIRSRAREQLFPRQPLVMARVQEIVGFVECTDTARWANHSLNKFHTEAGGIAFGILPVSDKHVVWYMQFDSELYPAPTQDANLIGDFVRRLVRHWADPIAHLLSKTDFSRVHVWHPVDNDLVTHFYQGNLVLVGDAAHPFLPFASQGVSAAIADAVSLANHLMLESNMQRALAQYSDERRAQCRPYIGQGRALARLFLAERVSGDATIPIAH